MCAPEVVAATHERVSLSRRTFGAAALAATVSVAVAPRAHAQVPVGRVVDLTHTLTPDFPVWPGNVPFARYQVGFGPLGGFNVNNLHLCEHVGTHLDAPAHVDGGTPAVEALDPADLVAPLIVLSVAAGPETAVTVADVLDWERSHGPIPARAFVALHTGWERRLAQPGAFVNADSGGQPHSPGFSGEAAEFLVRERDIVGVGADTLSLDRAADRSHPAHLAILGAGRYGVEALAGLEGVPPSGATVVVGAPKHAGGTGGPCRVLALVG